jgi:HEAT repeat protein
MTMTRIGLTRIGVMAIALAVMLFVTAPLSAQKFLTKDAAAWTEELSAADEVRRRSAAFALGKLGSAAAEAAPALRKTMEKDESPKVREAAAFALGEIVRGSLKVAADPQLVPALTAALKDEHWLVRRSAAYALGCVERDAAPAQDVLEALLKDAFPEVRQNAAWALGKLGTAAIPKLRVALRDGDPLVKRDAAAALGQMEPVPVRVALDDLLALCADKSPEARRAAVGVLVRIVGPEDEKATPPLRTLLADSDEETRRNAALALSNVGGKDAAAGVPILVDALSRGEIELRRQAAAALRNLGPAANRAVPELTRALKDSDAELRTNAALALGGVGPAADKAVPALVGLVADAKDAPEPRMAAAVALSSIGPVPAAIDAVPRLLQVVANAKDDATVRWRIIWALRVHNVNLRKLEGIYPAFTKVLGEEKTEDNRMLRYDCAYLLGVLQRDEASKEVLDTLLDFLKDNRVQIYVNTQATVPGAGQEKSGGKATVKEVGQGDGRVMATQALAQIGGRVLKSRPDIVEQLRLLATDNRTEPELRKACQSLLKDAGN